MRQRLLAVPFAALVLALALVACSSDEGATKADDAPPADAPAVDTTSGGAAELSRGELNRIAAELYLPLFWTRDKNGDGQLNPDELAVLWGFPGADTRWEHWVQGGVFTPAAEQALARIRAVKAGGHDNSKLTPEERSRRKAVLAELEQGYPTLVYTDLSGASDEDRAIVGHMMSAAALIEQLHARQNAVEGMRELIPTDDPMSRTVLYRNQGPWCVAPKTESDPDCNALVGRPEKVSGLYPKALQQHKDFCDTLAARPDAKELMDPFVVVVDKGSGDVGARPYTEHYQDLMEKVAVELEAAAAAIKDPAEDPFKQYLLADAKAFRTNAWEDADEAWAKMSVDNSKWYLRLAPDEVYFEPCSRKAGFHMSFAYINQGSVAWQRKLEPVKMEMEQALADLAGEPYVARDVAFHLPDFIDIILNAGDSRAAHGATIGQSLPNWGRVAEAGGRTVAMTNLYTDPDSLAFLEQLASSMFCADTMALVDLNPELGTMSTVLHEAAHNLGPSHEYRAFGKTAPEIFGGPLASMLEELKAQTSALYFADWLAEKEIISDEMAQKAHLRDLLWAMGHISRGMYTADNKPRAYSQLAAIQLGYLIDEGAVRWFEDVKAANGTDTGCLAVTVGRMGGAIDKLADEVLTIKGAGKKAEAEKLKQTYVDDDGAFKTLRGVIQERWLRVPKATFVYSVRQ
jgi:hypothetical protein